MYRFIANAGDILFSLQRILTILLILPDCAYFINNTGQTPFASYEHTYAKQELWIGYPKPLSLSNP